MAKEESPDTSSELSAAAYDRLQFGVDFARRGAFRAALAEAVEAVVAGYVPPPGSLDEGPRSIYATTVVEEWLRAPVFPRRASVAGSAWPDSPNGTVPKSYASWTAGPKPGFLCSS